MRGVPSKMLCAIEEMQFCAGFLDFDNRNSCILQILSVFHSKVFSKQVGYQRFDTATMPDQKNITFFVPRLKFAHKKSNTFIYLFLGLPGF